MRIWIFCFLCASVSNCVGSVIGTIPDSLKLGAEAQGVFVSTNENSSPFYFVATNLNLPAMIGEKLDTNVITNAKMVLVSQYVPSAKWVQGRVAPAGYVRFSGRFAKLDGSVLTLTDFEMNVSDEDGDRGEVMSVCFGSLSFQASAAFAAEVRRMLLKAPQRAK